MQLTRRNFMAGAALTLGVPSLFAHEAGSAPAPFGALPSANQLAWHRLETYAFLHFTVNTFTDREWGHGDEDPSIFQPSDFDADAIVEDLQRAGMKAVILTCKHHDGFCLWPTATTEHCIRNSSWRGGKGDVVREISEAARRHGLKFGVYVSPWDRNNLHYAQPEYLDTYHAQITELLTNYGPVFEVWFDGANGGDGYYGGAREKRSIDKNYYEWPKIFALVHRLQLEAVIFQEGGDIRWVGNEKGFAGETCWATYSISTAKDDMHASADGRDTLTTGTRLGDRWMPAECDVSIRPGWFYHAQEDAAVRTADNLLNLYFESVGRGASLLLNFPPDRRGRIGQKDAAAAQEFHQRLESLFRRNLAAEATLRCSNVRGRSQRYGAHALVDGDWTTYWATDDAVHTPEVVAEFHAPVDVGVVRLREAIALGQRIGAVEVDAWQQGSWITVGKAASIGACRLIRLDNPVQTQRLRLRITDSPVAVALSELGVYPAI